MIRTAVTTAVALTAVISTASAETITVCASGCDYTSINAAIAAASDGDVIQLSAETYLEGETIDTLGKAIALRGDLNKAGEPASVLDGQASHTVIRCEGGAGEAFLEDLVIQNGQAMPGEYGGGLYARQCALVIRHCRFIQNEAEDGGGGIFATQAGLRVESCTFEANFAVWGGGIRASGCDQAAIVDCLFQENAAAIGAGIGFDERCSGTVSECTFSLNNSQSCGGGVDVYWFCTIEFSGCHFFGNHAGYSGGALNNLSKSFVDCRGCTFRSNVAPTGSAVYQSWSSDNADFLPENRFLNCTFLKNSSGPESVSIHSAEWTFAFYGDSTFEECCPIYPLDSMRDLGGNDYESWCDDCRGNLDCRNDTVDAGDLGYLLARWGTNDQQSDIDEDGTVAASDLGLLVADWGPCQ